MRIALFVTCLADTLFPDVGRATVTVLERLGHEVVFPPDQTCCGQMHTNTGYADGATRIVRHHVEVQATLVMSEALQRRSISAISTVAWALQMQPDQLEAVASAMAEQANLDEALVLRAARRVTEQLAQAQEHGR